MKDALKLVVPKSIEDMAAAVALPSHDTGYLMTGRIVAEDLLRERFAFAGSIVLNHDEIRIVLTGLYSSERYPSEYLTQAIRVMESKVSPLPNEEKHQNG